MKTQNCSPSSGFSTTNRKYQDESSDVYSDYAPTRLEPTFLEENMISADPPDMGRSASLDLTHRSNEATALEEHPKLRIAIVGDSSPTVPSPSPNIEKSVHSTSVEAIASDQDSRMSLRGDVPPSIGHMSWPISRISDISMDLSEIDICALEFPNGRNLSEMKSIGECVGESSIEDANDEGMKEARMTGDSSSKAEAEGEEVVEVEDGPESGGHISWPARSRRVSMPAYLPTAHKPLTPITEHSNESQSQISEPLEETQDSVRHHRRRSAPSWSSMVYKPSTDYNQTLQSIEEPSLYGTIMHDEQVIEPKGIRFQMKDIAKVSLVPQQGLPICKAKSSNVASSSKKSAHEKFNLSTGTAPCDAKVI